MGAASRLRRSPHSCSASRCPCSRLPAQSSVRASPARPQPPPASASPARLPGTYSGWPKGEPLRASASVAEPLPASSDTPRQGFSCGSVGSGALASGLMSGNGRLPPPSESGRSVAAGLDSPQPGASGLLPRVTPKLEATRRGAHGLASAQRERWPPRKASRRRVPGLLTLAWSLLAVTVWPSAACWPRWPPRRRC